MTLPLQPIFLFLKKQHLYYFFPQGSHVIDGGFTVNLPRISDATITVSPFAGCATICPPDNKKVKTDATYRVRREKREKILQ